MSDQGMGKGGMMMTALTGTVLLMATGVAANTQSFRYDASQTAVVCFTGSAVVIAGSCWTHAQGVHVGGGAFDPGSNAPLRIDVEDDVSGKNLYFWACQDNDEDLVCEMASEPHGASCGSGVLFLAGLGFTAIHTIHVFVNTVASFFPVEVSNPAESFDETVGCGQAYRGTVTLALA